MNHTRDEGGGSKQSDGREAGEKPLSLSHPLSYPLSLGVV